jgi:hypothetical protein
MRQFRNMEVSGSAILQEPRFRQKLLKYFKTLEGPSLTQSGAINSIDIDHSIFRLTSPIAVDSDGIFVKDV